LFRRLLSSITVMVAIIASTIMPGVTQAVPHSPNEVPPSRFFAGSRTFSETGHTVSNYFYQKWASTPNALFVYGMPISQPFIEESFTNPGEFYRVQYFERAVLEEHPDNTAQFYVQGRLMGSRLVASRQAETPFKAVADPRDGTYDSVSKHTLRDSPAPFRTFYNNNGGLTVFGRPLSEQFQEVNKADGKTYWVQYFERQRMEWHPTQSNPQYRILLGLLGNEYRDASHKSNPAFTPGAALPPELAGPQASTMTSSRIAYGVNINLSETDSGIDRKRSLQMTRDAGLGWVRFMVYWKFQQDISRDIKWGELDAKVNDAHAAGIKVLVTVAKSPAWATANGSDGMPRRENFGDFNNFLSQVATRYKGKINAYEVWNEPNLAHENGGRVAGAAYYMDLLVGASQAIKKSDPSALVVSAGPSSTETNLSSVAMSDLVYFDQMFSDPRFNQHVDIVGAHPGGAANPADTCPGGKPSPANGWTNNSEFFFCRVEDVKARMDRYGINKPMWVTEYGWATPNHTVNYRFGNQTSYEKQAEYIIQSLELANTKYSPWLTGLFLWNLNYSVSDEIAKKKTGRYGDDPFYAYSIINADYSPRPAYNAIKAYLKR